MISDNDLTKQWAKHKKASLGALSLQYKNNLENQSYYAGNMMTYTDTIMGRGNSRTMVAFSLVQPYIDTVCGFMAQNRRKAEYQAREEDNQLQQSYSEYANGVADYERGKCHADQVETQQDRDVLICGYGAVDTNISYGLGWSSRDPNGDTVIERVDPGEVGWDPMARATNLLDSTFVYRMRQFDLSTAEKLFDQEAEDFEQAPEDQGEYKEWYPQGGIFNKIGYDFAAGRQDLVNVYYYQWYDIEDYWRCKNPIMDIQNQVMQQYIMSLFEFMMKKRLEEAQSDRDNDIDDLFTFDTKAEYLVMTTAIKNDVAELFKRFNVPFKPVKAKRRVYYTSILSGTKIFKKFKSPDQNGFTIKFKTAYWDEVNKVWFGMVSSLRDPVLYYNKALTELMYTIAANSKGGVMIEENAVDDVSTFEKQYAKTNAVAIVNDGAISGGKIMPKATPLVNSGLTDIINLSSAAIPMVANIDKTFMGSSENKMETAALQRQRIRQITSALATYFDSITLYQVEEARLMLTYIRILAENSMNRLVRIVGKDGVAAFTQLHADKFADEYDIIIAEAPTTPQYKEELANTMMNLGTLLAQEGKPIWGTVVDYLDIKQSDAQKIKEAINPTPQQQAMQQQQMQLQQELGQVHLEASKAKVSHTLADSQLKQAAIAEKQAAAALKFSDAQQRNLENEALVTTPPTHVNMTV